MCYPWLKQNLLSVFPSITGLHQYRLVLYWRIHSTLWYIYIITYYSMHRDIFAHSGAAHVWTLVLDMVPGARILLCVPLFSGTLWAQKAYANLWGIAFDLIGKLSSDAAWREELLFGKGYAEVSHLLLPVVQKSVGQQESQKVFSMRLPGHGQVLVTEQRIWPRTMGGPTDCLQPSQKDLVQTYGS